MSIEQIYRMDQNTDTLRLDSNTFPIFLIEEIFRGRGWEVGLLLEPLKKSWIFTRKQNNDLTSYVDW